VLALVEQDAARRQVDEFGCGLDACDQLGVVRGEVAFQNGLQQVVSVSIVPVRFRHGRASHRWTTKVCQIVLQFAIPFQSRPAAEASHAAWRTGPYRLIVVIATAQLQLQRGHDARDTRPISEVSPSPAMAEYALMRRVSIAIWRLFFGRRRVDRRLAAVLVADVAFVGGGTQGDISRSWRSSQSRSLRSRALAFFGNHDEALAYPRRALALNHGRLPVNFRYALLATEIARRCNMSRRAMNRHASFYD
jgi:hypothetical protein